MLRKYAGVIAIIFYIIVLIAIFEMIPFIAAITILVSGIWKLSELAIVIGDWAEEKFE